MLNFLSGISIDLYAPSMPSMTKVFHTSTSLMQNTLSATLLGSAIGAVLFGTLIDSLGRKYVITLSLFAFSLLSLGACFANSIFVLMLIRLGQGMLVSASSIGSRAFVLDHFTGKTLTVALLYTSVAYALGPIVGPFFGGILQHYFNWQANFIAYAVYSGLLCVLVSVFYRESIPMKHPLSLRQTTQSYAMILKNGAFMAGMLILSCVLIEQVIYPTLGPFIIQSVLHYSAVTYGKLALIVGGGYLVGTITNRLLVHYITPKQAVISGMSILFFALLLHVILIISNAMQLLTFILPLTVIEFGVGFIFANIIGICLQLFPKNVGHASAVQALMLTLLAALGTFLISHAVTSQSWPLFGGYVVLVSLQVIGFIVLVMKMTISP